MHFNSLEFGHMIRAREQRSLATVAQPYRGGACPDMNLAAWNLHNL